MLQVKPVSCSCCHSYLATNTCSCLPVSLLDSSSGDSETETMTCDLARTNDTKTHQISWRRTCFKADMDVLFVLKVEDGSERQRMRKGAFSALGGGGCWGGSERNVAATLRGARFAWVVQRQGRIIRERFRSKIS